MRQELAEAEGAFRIQYDETKQSIEDQLQATRNKLAEIERDGQAQLAELQVAGTSPAEAEEARRVIDGTLARLKAEYAANEAMFKAALGSAAEIIESR